MDDDVPDRPAKSSWWRQDPDSPWPRRSPARFKAAIPPAVIAVVGLVLRFALPQVPVLGLVIFLGGLAATIIVAFLAGVGD